MVYSRKFHKPTNAADQRIVLAIDLYDIDGQLEIDLNSQRLDQVDLTRGKVQSPHLLNLKSALQVYNTLQLKICTTPEICHLAPALGEQLVRAVALHIFDE